jgi:hypothetical protein
MDMVAPNPAVMSTGFVQLGIIVVFAIVAAVKRNTGRHPLAIWSKLNAPLVSIALGEVWAVLTFVMQRSQGLAPLDDYFIVGVWIAGGSGLIGSIVKDAVDGSVTTATPEGVAQMRANNASHGGIG